MEQQNPNEETENLGKEAVKNAITPIEKPLSDFIKNSKGTLIMFEDKEATKAKLEQIVKTYSPEIAELIKIPELNPQQLIRAKQLRAIHRDPRLELQRIEKHNTKTLNDAKTEKKSEIDEFISIVTPNETIIDEKIKAEENRKAEEKRIAEEKETERKRLINAKITDAGIAFERMILIGKTQEDLDKFDAEVKKFEDDLDSLEEFAYEGNELLERVKPRRSEIFDRVEDARLQAEKDLELQSKEQDLTGKESELTEKEQQLKQREQDLAEREAAQNKITERVGRVVELGLTFDGIQYVKDDFNVAVVEIQTKTDEEFKTMISNIANEITKRNEAKAKAEANMEKYLSLKDDFLQYTGTELDTDLPIVTDELISAVEKAIEVGKTEKAQEEQRKRIESIKNVGAAVIPAIESSQMELIKNIAPDMIENNEAKEIIVKFFATQAQNIEKLKAELYQQ